MRVHLYSICWNDAAMLGYFFRHYDRFVERYVLYDDGSDADTLSILHAHPRTEVRPMPRLAGNSYMESARLLRNVMWKESRGAADWVIVTDVDEHLYHPDLAFYLEWCRAKGVTAIPGLGFQMIGRHFPAPDALLCRDCTRGAPSHEMCKLALFDPNRIDGIDYDFGRHTAKPTGTLRYPPRDELLNLHYKYIDVEYVLKRDADLLARHLRQDRGAVAVMEHYDHTSDQLIARIDALDREAVDVVDQGLRAWATYHYPGAPRWWNWPPWWRMRWWHFRWWWSALPTGIKRPAKAVAKALGLLP
jgi:hypothetical protein